MIQGMCISGMTSRIKFQAAAMFWAAGLVSLSPMGIAGGLLWINPVVQIKTGLDQQVVNVTFSFRNDGARIVRIVDIKSDCDCTTTKLSKETWAPGESGEITASLGLQSRSGRQERRVYVTTDDAPDKPTLLTFMVEIPEAVGITPRFLWWKSGASAEEQSAIIILSDPHRMQVDEVRCVSPLFSPQLEAAGAAGHYRLRVRPLDTERPAQAVIELRVTVAKHQKTFLVYAVIK